MQTLETKQYLSSNLINNLPNEQDLNRKVTKSLEKCTSCIYSISNEPTLACFCIEEHLYKTGLQLVDKNEKMRQLDKQLTGALIDIEFSIESIKRMKNTSTNFKATQDLIKDAIFHKQQIDYNNLNKRRFNQQMEKDHSINDFRKFTNSSNTRSQFQTKQNAFQRFSTSFEASIEGLASSASVEFKDAFKHISQLTSSNFGTLSNTNNRDVNLSNSLINDVNKSTVNLETNDVNKSSVNLETNDDLPTSSNKINESIEDVNK